MTRESYVTFQDLGCDSRWGFWLELGNIMYESTFEKKMMLYYSDARVR